MTDGVRRLAALAAVFAPARAGVLLARLPDPEAADAIEAAAALAGAPRRDRLRALAGALAGAPAEALAGSEASAGAERERIAACLRAVAVGDAAGRISPALLRLCRERIGR